MPNKHCDSDRESANRRKVLKSLGIVGGATLTSGLGAAAGNRGQSPRQNGGNGRAKCVPNGGFNPNDPTDVKDVLVCLRSAGNPQKEFEKLPADVKEGLKDALTVADLQTETTETVTVMSDDVSAQDHDEFVKTVSAHSKATNAFGMTLCEFTHYCRFTYDGTNVYDITHWSGNLGAYHGWTYDGTVRDTVQMLGGNATASKTEAFSVCIDFCIDNDVIGNKITMHSTGDWGATDLS